MCVAEGLWWSSTDVTLRRSRQVEDSAPNQEGNPMASSRALVAWFEVRIAGRVDALYEALGRNRVTRFPWAVIRTFSEGQGALLSGSMAYYTFLSLLPLLMVAGFIVAAISKGDPALQVALIKGVERMFPGARGQEILDQLIGARVAFGIFGLVTVSYAATGFVGALTASLNRMWRVQQGRNPVGQKFLNIVVVILLGVVLLGSAGLTVRVAYLTRTALGRNGGTLARQVESLASPLSLFCVLLLLYRILPAWPLSWRSQVPGAASGAVGIELLKRAFAFWAQHSAGVAVLPRSLLSVALLLVWLGLLCQLILYGAAVNVVGDRRRRGAPLGPAENRTMHVAE
jgi:membrane protein